MCVKFFGFWLILILEWPSCYAASPEAASKTSDSPVSEELGKLENRDNWKSQRRRGNWFKFSKLPDEFRLKPGNI